MSAELTPPMIVAWFRNQARKFNEMADFVEGTFAAGLPQLGNGSSKHFEIGDISAEKVREAVSRRGHRRADLARRFQVPMSRVEEIIKEPNSGLRIVKRGWVKLSEEHEK